MKTFTSIVLAAAFCLSTVSAMAANVNKDDAATIAKELKGVGVKRAELIVTVREDGKFKDATDLIARVKGIGPKTVSKNKSNLEF